MNLLFQAALEFQNYFTEKNWKFCIIGGLAVIRWGELRTTQDIDISLLSGFNNEELFIDSLLKDFKSRISDARNFALENRVLLLKAHNNVSTDIALAALPFEAEMIQRSSPFQYDDNCILTTCSAEDLIILKAFASRAQDWIDIEGIIIRQSINLNTGYIHSQLEPLANLKKEIDILGRLKALFQKYSKQDL